MRERLACDHHPRVAGMDKISPILRKTAPFCARRGHVTGLRRLTKDGVALWPVPRPSLPYPPLRGAPGAVAGKRGRVQTLTMVQQRDRLKSAVLRRKRQRIGLPISCKSIRDGAAIRDLAGGWQRRTGVKTPRSAFAEPGTGGRGSLICGCKGLT